MHYKIKWEKTNRQGTCANPMDRQLGLMCLPLATFTMLSRPCLESTLQTRPPYLTDHLLWIASDALQICATIWFREYSPQESRRRQADL